MSLWHRVRGPAFALALGGLGGAAGWLAGVPLGVLLGAMVAVGVVAARGGRLGGASIEFPQQLRLFFVPVIGVGIGGAFTPEVVAQMPGWWPSLLALCLYIPLAHLSGYAIYRLGGLPKPEAFFGAVPGGLIESVALGEEAGADVRMLVLLQFLRLILTIVAVPLIFLVLTGHAVGSASGATLAAKVALDPADALVLIAAGCIGFWVGRLLHLPAAPMTGPMAASACVHLLGWAEGVPPGWAVALTQIVVGTGLGARFIGMNGALLRRGFALASGNVAVALLLAFGFGLAMAKITGEPVTAVFLAFAPGGLAEMSLIALSLQMGIVFVTVHHVARIVLSVALAKLGARWIMPG
ncbi:AbrB family transcriptional regulator [Gemmobacter fulvus]|uniref:AbrB family transcriptional regulator n=1 Tax=Gemmobacter fulvus TaxID=2840474 RepID=A0A975P9Z1_9RHOB|nr:AbrB family transcriptional regulator [Gemmobacter fulvus]MBT9247311.1 AbrB family transcriptional regulator [Gemmobacter fulvus]MDQ1850053.1 AbrB family transcriptional regulator [Gemmobacter fulvus]QWK91768.1 AbrB family transcriptional regulator [Gemmobacter fulvus]